ncbi:MAG: RIP metalloprotease RseP [Candidatus Moranbacteria bacterium]|nr:RIP metalloprotease RseP [Candidatus Moranbacteria bacterium]
MTIGTLVIFIVMLGVLVLVHEYGHYFVAVRSGIRAEEFGFGFPPRLVGFYRKRGSGKWGVVLGEREAETDGTVWSLNWIPFGGFVRMKGEDENARRDRDSFASKGVWTRVAVLSAGVVMNFLLAWAIVSALYVVGVPRTVTDETRANASDVSVMIMSVAKSSPAEEMGLRPGDRIVAIEGESVSGLTEAKQAIDSRRGTETVISIDRSGTRMDLHGTPRSVTPENEGALGIAFAEMGIVRYPWYEAPFRGAVATWNASVSVASALFEIVRGIVLGRSGAGDVTGPIGIVYATREVADLGPAYLLQFAAILSINLAIFNILPIPALDGGRILFVLIEKFKGAPVREIVEQRFHQIGFLLLLLLMLAVTVRDVAQFRILEKVWQLIT